MKNELGLVHIYCGDGKGKTTAAMGLALRAIGSGLNVVVVQFLKNGNSGEIKLLQTLPNVKIFANFDINSFSFSMNDEENIICKKSHELNFQKATELCNNKQCDVLILDEIIGAINKGFFDESKLLDFIKNKTENIEVIMTGRNPTQNCLDVADYVSNISKVKHPFDKGICARVGIEK